MSEDDYLLSLVLSASIQAQPYRCWRNAAIGTLACMEALPTCCYVEGWIVMPRSAGIEIVEHGWIRVEERILDPSLVLVEKRPQPVEYYPGFWVPCQDLPRRMAGQVLPLVCHGEYGTDGLLHPGYQEAFTLAWQRARKWAQERQLPETAIVVSGKTPTGATTLIAY